MKVKQFLEFLNEYAPVKYADSFDNVGLLVGDGEANVKSVCICLDITNDVIEEAVKKKSNLIISHHPVIFNPLKSVESGTPVYNLIKHKINAICMHTNADVTIDGISDMMLEMLDLGKAEGILEVKEPGNIGYGRIVTLPVSASANSLAECCKKAFECSVVRYIDTIKPISKVGVCSGAGYGVLDLAIKAGCDALITGDVKHNIWIDCQNLNFCIIDAGHFHTENIFCNYIVGILSRKFHNMDIYVAENSKDPCSYIV